MHISMLDPFKDYPGLHRGSYEVFVIRHMCECENVRVYMCVCVNGYVCVTECVCVCE